MRYWPFCLSIHAEIPLWGDPNACFVFRKSKQEFIKLVRGSNLTNSVSRNPEVKKIYVSGQVSSKTTKILIHQMTLSLSAVRETVMPVDEQGVNDGRIERGFRVMAIYNY